MFFFKRSKKYENFNEVGIDMHSHLIPGVDDGAKDIQDSIALITGLKELGFYHLISTPHTLQDIHPNTANTLQNAYQSLENQLPEGISLGLSSEYYLDEQFQDQLDNNALIPLPGNKLLIEFSQITRPNDLEDKIFNLGIKGYEIILAHPERYLFFHQNFIYFNRLKEMGVELQVNAMSLTSHYGKHVQNIAEKLIEKDMIDFIGTDLHHSGHLHVLKKALQSKHFTRLMESGLLKNQSLI